MFAGHYAAGFLAKRYVPHLNLGWLLLASQGIDVVWAALVLSRREHLRIVPHFTATNPFDFYDMPYSHSLVAALAWSTGAAVIAKIFRGNRSGIVVGVVVLSHWLLDLVVHVPDLTWMGGGHKLGFGLWRFAFLSTTLEFLILLVSLALYIDGSNARSFFGRVGIPLFATILLTSHLVVYFATPVSSSRQITALAIFGYLFFAAFGGLIDTQRVPRGAASTKNFYFP